MNFEYGEVDAFRCEETSILVFMHQFGAVSFFFV